VGPGLGQVASLEEELADTRWKPLRALARGGMAEVHVVTDRYIGGSWALKVLSPELAWPEEGASPEAVARHEREVEALRERLLAEGRILRAAEHENVVHVYEYGLTRSARPYLVMELLEGETLKQALRERGRFELGEAVDLLRQALRGMAWVHRLDAVHRDLKPENLYWCAPRATNEGGATHERRVLKILDFGIAKLLTDEAKARMGRIQETRTGLALGTPLYMAPEQIGGRAVDERADLYALGCVAYHLLTGRPPFGGDALTLMQMHLRVMPVAPSRAAPHAAPLDAWVLRALAKDPAARFPSASAMLDALESAVAPAKPAAELGEATTAPLGPHAPAAAQPPAPTAAQPPAPTAARPPAPAANAEVQSDTLFVSSELDKLHERFPEHAPEDLLALAGDDARAIVGLSPRPLAVTPTPSADAASGEERSKLARRDFGRVALVDEAKPAPAAQEPRAAEPRAAGPRVEIAAERAARLSERAGFVAPATLDVHTSKPRSFALARAIVPLALLVAVLVWWLLMARG